MLGELFCACIYSERRFITPLNRDGLMQVLEDLLYESLGPGEGVTGADLYLTYLIYSDLMGGRILRPPISFHRLRNHLS